MPSEQTADSSNSSARRVPNKRKREVPAGRAAARSSKNNTPNAYARRTPPPDPEGIDDEEDGERSPPRKLKRPGASARFTASAREAVEQQRKHREEEARRGPPDRFATAAERVAEHYNAVPERGRNWRKTDSKIKGLRSLNNWVKSTLIQKFSRPDIPVADLRVLDMACGKGGDLGKWEKAPQVPRIYIGCDIASVSVEQARQRYSESQRRGHGRFSRGPSMLAEFYVHDAFGRPLSDVPAVRSIGFDPNAGPGPNIIQGGMMSGGFDVISMMFALHYSFETEELARGMLKNVSGALKKGGRFIGVMPNSDVISATMKRLLSSEDAGKTPNGVSTPIGNVRGDASNRREDDAEEDDWDPEKPSEPTNEEDEWDPEKPSEPQLASPLNGAEGNEDDWDPEKPSEPALATETAIQSQSPLKVKGKSTPADDANQPSLTWGNSIYTVRFSRQQPLTKRPLPRDGIFRPPYGWRYHYSLEEAVDVPEYVVPWEGFRALAEDYGLELMYRKGFREVFEDESGDRELGILAERMGVMSRDRSLPNGGLLVSDEEMEGASFYHAFCFYKT